MSGPPGDRPRLEASPRRLRVVVSGEVVADTTSAQLLLEDGRLPVYLLPVEDVRMGLLEPGRSRPGRPSTGPVRDWSIRVGDTIVAESDRCVIVFETGLRPRYYLPERAVRADLLEASGTVTSCPYKGTTSRYLTIRTAERVVEDAIWVYDDPRPEAGAIAGLLGFYDERVTVEVGMGRFSLPSAGPAV